MSQRIPIDLRDVMTADFGRLRGRARRLEGEHVPHDDPRWAELAAAIEVSRAKRAARAASVPAIVLDESLPITSEAERIVAAIRDNPVVIVAGETGSGKTTQLPKLCLAAGRGAAGMIGCTQPRRIAARSVARRVAQELKTEVGELVGYQVRFTDQVSERSLVKFMTDGILLAETQGDAQLSRYDTIIVDEAHERSLNIDFLLGYLKRLVAKRPELRIIVTSATIDTERFAAHFGGAPVIAVEGRSYPVDVRWLPPAEERTSGDDERRGRRPQGDLATAIVEALDAITADDRLGDVLVFLPGEREIRDAHLALARRKYRSTEVLALYARLSAKEQDRVFNPGTGRRIVLATNVAETSLTVPRIRYVVDPGLARVNRFSHRNKVQRLHVEPISQASAEQRKGRCGRVGPGVCYRLYDEADFLARPRYTEPELLRSSLAGVILRLMSLKLGPIEEFPFLDPPNERLIADGYQTLLELDAIAPDRRALTAIGRELARLPIDVKLGRMLIEAQRRGSHRELLVIAAFLSIQDPRERPSDARAAADLAHAPFADNRSDFVGVLKLWEAYRVAHEELTQSKLRDWCDVHFLSFLRMREWRELHRQLLVLGEERQETPGGAAHGQFVAKSRPKTDDARTPVGLEPSSGRGHGPLLPAQKSPDDIVTKEQYESIHRALLSGFPGQIGRRDEKGQYQGTRGRRYAIFPGSGLAKSQPAWLLSAIYLDTARLYGLMNARVEPLWIEQQAAHLVKKRWFDPHWSRKDGRVMAYEQVTLFGLTLVEKRRVNFERIDPAEARRVFIRAALVTGDIDAKATFLRENMAVLAAARDEEAKRRRRGLVADDETLAAWLEPRIPDGLASAAGLDAWWKTLSPEARRALVWTLADVLDSDAGGEAQFPEKLDVLGRKLALEYRFEPGHVADGVTLKLPLELLNAVPSARLGWLVPGFRVELVAELIRGLPKPLRRNFVPAPDFARAFCNAVVADDGAIVAALSRWLARTTGVEVPADAWDVAGLPPYLRMNVRLLDERREPLAEGRDLDALREEYGARARNEFARATATTLARSGIVKFDFDALPASVTTDTGLAAFPAIVDDGASVAIRVFERADDAAEEHARGMLRLLRLTLADKLRQAKKQLPLGAKVAIAYTAIDSPERLRDDVVETALDDIARARVAVVRERAAFETLAADIGRTLFAAAVKRLEHVEATLEAYAGLLPKLKPPLLGYGRASYDDLRTQLAGLVYPGFARELSAERLADIPRYVKAMSLRVDRLVHDPRKDQARMLEVLPFVDALAAARKAGRPPAAIERLRWLIEEFRVQLFAQELKTREPVSDKRLRKLIEELAATP